MYFPFCIFFLAFLLIFFYINFLFLILFFLFSLILFSCYFLFFFSFTSTLLSSFFHLLSSLINSFYLSFIFLRNFFFYFSIILFILFSFFIFSSFLLLYNTSIKVRGLAECTENRLYFLSPIFIIFPRSLSRRLGTGWAISSPSKSIGPLFFRTFYTSINNNSTRLENAKISNLQDACSSRKPHPSRTCRFTCNVQHNCGRVCFSYIIWCVSALISARV